MSRFFNFIEKALAGAGKLISSSGVKALVAGVKNGEFDNALQSGVRLIQSLSKTPKSISLPSDGSAEKVGATINELGTFARETFLASGKVLAPALQAMFVTGKATPAEAQDRLAMVTTQPALALLDKVDTAKIALPRVFSAAEVQKNIEEMEPGRILDTNTVASQDRYDTIMAVIDQAERISRSLKGNSNIMSGGQLVAGDAKIWKLDTANHMDLNDAATSGLGVIPTEAGSLATYVVPAANQKTAASNYTHVLGQHIQHKEADTGLPSSGAGPYRWNTRLALMCTVKSTADLSTYNGLTLRLSIGDAEPVYKDIEMKVHPLHPKRCTTSLRFDVPGEVELLIDAWLIVGVTGADVTVSLEFSKVQSRGEIKDSNFVVNEEYVSYWDGASLRSIERDAEWVQYLGSEVRRDVINAYQDPNLSLEALWKRRVQGSYVVERLAAIANEWFSKTAVMHPSINHNALAYADIAPGLNLQQCSSMPFWIYADGPMANLSQDKRLALMDAITNSISAIRALFVADPAFRNFMYTSYTRAA